NTCAPGTRIRRSERPHSRKKSTRSRSCIADSVVKRGKGDRLQPSNDGGIRQTPPVPLRRFDCSTSLYSTNPYGGSVTTAWIDLSSHRWNQSRQSPLKRVARPNRK